MNFITLATLTDQTLLITPRRAWQRLRLAGDELAPEGDGVQMRIYGSGLVEVSEGWWDRFLIADGEYDGEYFDGNSRSTSMVRHAWDGDESVRMIRTETPYRGPILPEHLDSLDGLRERGYVIGVDLPLTVNDGPMRLDVGVFQ